MCSSDTYYSHPSNSGCASTYSHPAPRSDFSHLSETLSNMVGLPFPFVHCYSSTIYLARKQWSQLVKRPVHYIGNFSLCRYNPITGFSSAPLEWYSLFDFLVLVSRPDLCSFSNPKMTGFKGFHYISFSGKNNRILCSLLFVASYCTTCRAANLSEHCWKITLGLVFHPSFGSTKHEIALWFSKSCTEKSCNVMSHKRKASRESWN